MKQTQQNQRFGEVFLPQLALKLHDSPRIPGLSETQIDRSYEMRSQACFAAPAWADPFFFTTGNADGALGALSQSETPGLVETETADDFILTQTTVIRGATITGMIRRADVADITNVEIEVYHVFSQDPFDKPPSGKVPSRTNSPSDNEIDSATRDSSDGTLSFSYTLLKSDFAVSNTVETGINP